ncbi:MAG: 5-formyltetrahydrofolate cyclo-ligase [Clostridia bacterium]|nr:5-formyltetrahydrofolate cyclo-ligase [Clostridia bacterium]
MKNEIRKRVKQKLNTVTEDELGIASNMIAERLFESEEFKSASRIFIYKSFGKEVKTERIIERAIQLGKAVCIPKIDGENMYSLALESITEYYVDSYGILEPVGGEEVAPDLIVMPLIAFDNAKNRLGRGKGYYDRYCNSNPCTTVAIALSVQKEESIPADEWDFTPDVIITEKEILK